MAILETLTFKSLNKNQKFSDQLDNTVKWFRKHVDCKSQTVIPLSIKFNAKSKSILYSNGSIGSNLRKKIPNWITFR